VPDCSFPARGYANWLHDNCGVLSFCGQGSRQDGALLGMLHGAGVTGHIGHWMMRDPQYHAGLPGTPEHAQANDAGKERGANACNRRNTRIGEWCMTCCE